MNPTNTTTDYLLLFRGSDWHRGLSPAELQQAMGGFLGWFESLRAAGTLKSGQPLAPESRLVTGKDGRLVADGPFSEAKETIAGYFIVEAESLDAAVAIARQCPTLEHGTAVEVRPIAAECASSHRAREVSHEALTLAHA